MKNENFIKIKVMNVEQIRWPSSIYIGRIKFKDLLLIHKYTYRKESDLDPYSKEDRLKISKKEEEFQRELSKNRLVKIKKYIEENFERLRSKGKEGKSVGLFHTSIILSLNHDFEYNPELLEKKYLNKIYNQNPNLDSCFLKEGKDSHEGELFIPKKEKLALIVDGQHRFFALEKYYNSLNEEDKKIIEDHFEFLTTFLIGLDTYEIGEIFAITNFTQRPVNKSLYFDIFGSFPGDRFSSIKLAHDLALHLNNNGDSPIKDMIRLLGKGPGLISQAFFGNEMERLFKKVWDKLYEDFKNGGKDYKKISRFMKIYLECIEEVYNFAWPKRTPGKDEKLGYYPLKYEWILCKTTGLGGFFRLINDIYPLVEDKNELETKTIIKKILNKLPRKQAEKVFSKKGDFGGSGGEGLVSKFYRFLKLKLNL